jgi:hypothetical protein
LLDYFLFQIIILIIILKDYYRNWIILYVTFSKKEKWMVSRLDVSMKFVNIKLL